LFPKQEERSQWYFIAEHNRSGVRRYIEFCTGDYSSGVTWQMVGTWKLNGFIRGFEKGRSPLPPYLAEEDANHITVYGSLCS
jgi:hypothetical protein